MSLPEQQKAISKAIHQELDAAGYAFKAQLKDSLNNIHATKRSQLLEENQWLKPVLHELHQNGYVILRDVITATQCDEIQQVTDSLCAAEQVQDGRNRFEGKKTKRVYALLAKSRVYDKLLLHPKILAILDYLLLPNHLLTAFQAISIGANEKQQVVHYDDQFVAIPRPRKATSIATIWAIDDFTEENGATVVVPMSHKWGNQRVPDRERDTFVPAVMSRGSCLVTLGTTWHAGGANRTNKRRLAVTSQHCEPYIRQQENQFLSVPFHTVLNLHPRLQSMAGYSIHFPFIGHSNGQHPLKAIQSKL